MQGTSSRTRRGSFGAIGVAALLLLVIGGASQSVRLSSAAAATREGVPAGLAKAIRDRLGAGPIRLDAPSGGWATATTPEATITNATPSGSELGLAVAVSADGRTALVGAPGGANASPKLTGVAYVFRSDAPGSWASASTPVATLQDSNAPLNGRFGFAVALSADGTTAFIQGGGEFWAEGVVDVFHVASADSWVSTSTPTAALTDNGGTLWGPVAVSADGTTALVGADVFHVATENAWTTTSTPTATLGSGGNRKAVGLSADGTTALLGASPSSNDPGAAEIFHVASESAWATTAAPSAVLSDDSGTSGWTLGAALSGDGSTALLTIQGHGVEVFHASSEASWTSSSTPTARLSQPGTPEQQSGLSLALSSDGTTALIGGYAADTSLNYVYSVAASDAWATTSTPAATLRTGAPKESFGGAVSLSPDGTTAVIGAPSSNGIGGAFTFHVAAESGWSGSMVAGAMLATGLGGNGAASGFGYSVALSADGTTALVGAPFRDGGAGAVWVFQSSSEDGWASSTAVAVLLNGGDFADGAFGYSVALSADGTTALIGAPTEKNLRGAAYVFHVSAETAWASSSAPTARLSVAGGTAGDDLGYSVALAADGKTALAGARGVAKRAGAAYVFHVSSASAWSSSSTPAAALINSSGHSGDNLGSSVALSGDGATALVGAPIAHGIGAAYVFSAPSADSWTTSAPAATLSSGSATAAQHFGASAALSSDGTTALIGADGDAATAGAAYVFHASSPASWATSSTPAAMLTSEPSAAGDGTGRSVALSPDGTTALVGVSQPNHALNDGGEAAYVFTAPSADAWATSSTPATLASSQDGIDDMGRSVSLSSDATTALVGAPLGGPVSVGNADVFATVAATAGSPAKLAFTNGVPDGPGQTEYVDNAFATWVSVEDASGGPAAGPEPSEIGLEITPGTGNPNAQLHCVGANPAPVIAGTAFFACWVDKAGTGYTLTATANGVTSAVFPSFNVIGSLTITSVAVSANPVLVGQSVTYTTTTTVAAGTLTPKIFPPGGTVQFMNQTTSTVLDGCAAVPVSPSTGVAACTTTFPAVGVDNILVSYSGTTDFPASYGSFQQSVVKSLKPPPPDPILGHVPLQKAQLGTAGAGLAVAHDSGVVSNNTATSNSVIGKGGALTDLGRVSGFTLDYGDAFSGGAGVRQISTNLELYATAADATKGLAFWTKDDARRFAYLKRAGMSSSGGTVSLPSVGTQHSAWLETIHANVGSANPVSILDERAVDGRYVFDVRVAASSASAAKSLAPTLAKLLDQRLHLARTGQLHTPAPTLLAPQTAGPPAAGPDLSTVSIQSTDLGFGNAAHLQEDDYWIDPQARSAYRTIYGTAPTVTLLTQNIEWYSSAKEATLVASYNAALDVGKTVAGIRKPTIVNTIALANVGDNAWADILTSRAGNTYLTVMTLSRGKATDVITAASGIPLTPADVQQLAQTAANRLDVALPTP